MSPRDLRSSRRTAPPPWLVHRGRRERHRSLRDLGQFLELAGPRERTVLSALAVFEAASHGKRPRRWPNRSGVSPHWRATLFSGCQMRRWFPLPSPELVVLRIASPKRHHRFVHGTRFLGLVESPRLGNTQVEPLWSIHRADRPLPRRHGVVLDRGDAEEPTTVGGSTVLSLLLSPSRVRLRCWKPRWPAGSQYRIHRHSAEQRLTPSSSASRTAPRRPGLLSRD